MYAGGYHSVAIAPPRELTPGEGAILDFILEQEFAGRSEVRELLDGTTVEGVCRCECGSLFLTLAKPPGPEPPAKTPIEVEAVADVDGAWLETLLFVGDDGAFLELVWGDPDYRPRLPRPDELQSRRVP